jgi:hypothetical protein
MSLRRFIHLPVRWGWQCNSNWQGTGKAFEISIPTQDHLVVQGMKYNPQFKQIEVWGYLAEDKYVATEYNERHRIPKYVPADISRPEGKEGNG